MNHEHEALSCWAPEIAYDDAKKQYIIFWSTTTPGKFPESDGIGNEKYNHRMYCVTTKEIAKQLISK